MYGSSRYLIWKKDISQGDSATSLETPGQPRAAAQFLDFLLSVEGRAALERAGLLVRLDGEDGTALEISGTAETLQRPIALTPALLIALDTHKRALFRARWRDAFPETGGTAP